MEQILIANVIKKPKFGKNSGLRITFVSFDRDKLKKEIENHYKIKLVKDDIYDFPYFTDGGFKYLVENENFFFHIEAYLHKIIK